MTGAKKRRKMLFEASLLVMIVPVTLVLLVIYSASSLAIETWWMETKYEEGSRVTPSKFTAQIVIGVGNKGVLPVMMRNAKVKLIVNGIGMGSLDLEQEYNISASGWQRFEATFSVIGDDADSLGLASSYNLYLVLTGEASCIFYTAPFETASQTVWPE